MPKLCINFLDWTFLDLLGMCGQVLCSTVYSTVNVYCIALRTSQFQFSEMTNHRHFILSITDFLVYIVDETKNMCHEKVLVTSILIQLVLTLVCLGHTEKNSSLNKECQIIIEKPVQKTGR